MHIIPVPPAEESSGWRRWMSRRRKTRAVLALSVGSLLMAQCGPSCGGTPAPPPAPAAPAPTFRFVGGAECADPVNDGYASVEATAPGPSQSAKVFVVIGNNPPVEIGSATDLVSGEKFWASVRRIHEEISKAGRSLPLEVTVQFIAYNGATASPPGECFYKATL